MNSSSNNTTHDEDLVHRLINEGASLLDDRKYDTSIAILHKALSTQKGGTRRSVAARKVPQHHRSVQHRRHNDNALQSQQQSGQAHTPGIQQGCSSSKTAPFNFLNLVPSKKFIYKRPIYVPVGSFESCNRKSIQGVMSIAIVFNLALAHHMAGLDESFPGDSSVFLTKSLRLYNLAQQLVLKLNQESGQDSVSMLDPEQTTSSSSSELFNVVHLLGASNNIAQVHTQLGQHEVANRHFQQLLSSVVYLIHGKSNKDDLPESTVLRPLVEALFQSASHLVLRKYAADAAQT